MRWTMDSLIFLLPDQVSAAEPVVYPRFSIRICADDGCTCRDNFAANEAPIASYWQRRAAKVADNAPPARK